MTSAGPLCDLKLRRQELCMTKPGARGYCGGTVHLPGGSVVIVATMPCSRTSAQLLPLVGQPGGLRVEQFERLRGLPGSATLGPPPFQLGTTRCGISIVDGQAPSS